MLVPMKISQDFWEKIAILMVTAAVTGFFVPYVLKNVDETRTVEQQRREAILARQAKLLETQSKYLDETAEALWNWRYLSMKVAFNGSEGREADYQTAATEYQRAIWDVLSRIRLQTSKARRLTSERGYNAMVQFYDQIVEFDGRLDGVVRQKSSVDKRATELAPFQQSLRTTLTKRIDEVMALLAQEANRAMVETPASRK